jgi:hypothetical protein
MNQSHSSNLYSPFGIFVCSPIKTSFSREASPPPPPRLSSFSDRPSSSSSSSEHFQYFPIQNLKLFILINSSSSVLKSIAFQISSNTNHPLLPLPLPLPPPPPPLSMQYPRSSMNSKRFVLIQIKWKLIFILFMKFCITMAPFSSPSSSYSER